MVNEEYPLIFFHFSSFKYNRPNVISNNYRYDFDTNPELIPFYKLYNEKIKKNKIAEFSKIPCSYYKHRSSINFLKKIISYTEIILFKFKYYLNPM